MYIDIKSPQQNSDIIPLRWNISANKYDTYPPRRIIDVSLIGWLVKLSQCLKSNDANAPQTIPINRDIVKR